MAAVATEPAGKTKLERYEARAAELERQKLEQLQVIADAGFEEQAARVAETERAPSAGLTFKLGNPVDTAIKRRQKAEAKLANIEKDQAALAPLLNAERQKVVDAQRVVEERRHADALVTEEAAWRVVGEKFAEFWSAIDELVAAVEPYARSIPQELRTSWRVTGQDENGKAIRSLYEHHEWRHADRPTFVVPFPRTYRGLLELVYTVATSRTRPDSGRPFDSHDVLRELIPALHARNIDVPGWFERGDF